MSERQLMMKNTNLQDLPAIVLPAGYELHTGRADSKAVWEDIVVSSFDLEMTYEEGLNYDNCGPDNCWFCAVDGVDVATATSYTRPDYPNAAFLHMVGTHKKGLRKGAGKLAVLAVLHGLQKAGYEACYLRTDDFRLPAIAMYLSVGFEPIIDDEEMQTRWDNVRAKLAN